MVAEYVVDESADKSVDESADERLVTGSPEQAEHSEHSGHPDEGEPRESRRDFGSSARLWGGFVGRAWLWFLAGCVVVTFLPMLFGWRPYVIESGSMMPRIKVGDVILESPEHDPQKLLGHVTVFEDPDMSRAGTIKSHRVVTINPDGTMVTKGDANPTVDPVPLPMSDVKGIGRLLVRWIGLPLIWVQRGEWLLVGSMIASLWLAAVLVVRDREEPLAEDEDRDADEGGGDGVDGADEDSDGYAAEDLADVDDLDDLDDIDDLDDHADIDHLGGLDNPRDDGPFQELEPGSDRQFSREWTQAAQAGAPASRHRRSTGPSVVSIAWRPQGALGWLISFLRPARHRRRRPPAQLMRIVVARAGVVVLGSSALLVPSAHAAFSATTTNTTSTWSVATSFFTPPAFCSATSWNSTTIYLDGDQVTYGGHGWQARWYTVGEVPGAAGSIVWQDLGLCTPPPPGACSATPWNVNVAYEAGSIVSYDGRKWQAKWYTQGDEPTAHAHGKSAPWEDIGPCTS